MKPWTHWRKTVFKNVWCHDGVRARCSRRDRQLQLITQLTQTSLLSDTETGAACICTPTESTCVLHSIGTTCTAAPSGSPGMHTNHKTSLAYQLWIHWETHLRDQRQLCFIWMRKRENATGSLEGLRITKGGRKREHKHRDGVAISFQNKRFWYIHVHTFSSLDLTLVHSWISPELLHLSQVGILFQAPWYMQGNSCLMRF